MRNRLIFLAGVGVGYVLGARAGRERYEKLAGVVRRVRENPTVQETAGVIQAQAGGIFSTARSVVSDKLGHTSLGSRMGGLLTHPAEKPAPAAVGGAAHAGNEGTNGATPRSEL